MNEQIFSVTLSDIKLSAVLAGGSVQRSHLPQSLSVLSRLKMIHRHSAYELFFVPDGTLTVFTVNGSASYRDSVVIVPPYFDHYTEYDDNRYGCSCLYFYIEPAMGEGELFVPLSAILQKGVTALPISDDEHFYFGHLDDVATERENIGHLLGLLFSEIFRRLVPRVGKARLYGRKHGRHIDAIDGYLAAHYTEKISLSDLADELYLCTKQVARIIRREYGCSLSDLVNQRRLAAACMLLKYTELEIREVAAQVGYEYENYFYTRFHKQYGVTPRRFREQSGISGSTGEP